jgi:nitrous oxide reductase accessory protein NosL
VRGLAGLVLLLALAACSRDPGQGPVPVTFDRDACERCRMMISDRHYAAEVRLEPGRTVYKFDDLGCALIWAEQQPGGIAAAAEIWVTDHRDGRWLDARTAHYVTGKTTPMDYGLAAQPEPAPGSLDFAAAARQVLEKQRAHAAHAPPRTDAPGGAP